MKVRYVVSAVIIVFAIVVGVLASIGPKLGLQTPPIEAGAMTYLTKHDLLHANEVVAAYKAVSYYTYNQGVVITDQRIFAYDGAKVHSIPLNKISMVIIKNSDLGHQEVLVAAQQDGVIGIELYHTYVPEFIEMLKVRKSIIQDTTQIKHKEAAAK